MTDIKLFRTDNGKVEELPGQSVALERSLQRLIEANLEAFFGIRFLETEYQTGPTHGGRIDTLGIDENHFPVIIEYKRSTNENVINQGLFYLDWLLDHKAEFELLVLRKFGQAASDLIDWSSPRLICIAGDFTRYDEHAVQQMNRNIELIRYIRYADELILFELVNATTGSGDTVDIAPAKRGNQTYTTVTESLERASTELQDLYEELKAYLLGLGDDIQVKTTLYYFAFRRIRNFATVEVRRQAANLTVCVKVDPDSIQLEDGFTRDVSNIGHLGTGDLEITLRNRSDLERAKPLLIRSYEES